MQGVACVKVSAEKAEVKKGTKFRGPGIEEFPKHIRSSMHEWLPDQVQCEGTSGVKGIKGLPKEEKVPGSAVS